MLANCKAPLPTTSALTTTGRSNYKLWLCSRCRRSSTRRRRCRRSRCRGDSRSPTRRCRGQSVVIPSRNYCFNTPTIIKSNSPQKILPALYNLTCIGARVGARQEPEQKQEQQQEREQEQPPERVQEPQQEQEQDPSKVRLEIKILPEKKTISELLFGRGEPTCLILGY